MCVLYCALIGQLDLAPFGMKHDIVPKIFLFPDEIFERDIMHFVPMWEIIILRQKTQF